MSSYCSLHRLPRAGVDPITSVPLAMSLLSFVMADTMRHETIVLLLDHERRGIGVLVVTGTVPLDAVFDVVDVVTELEIDELDSVVLASVRPPFDDDGGTSNLDPGNIDPGESDLSDLDPGDVDRWIEASELLDRHGIELVEWFVIGHDVSCPREVFGEPPRW